MHLCIAGGWTEIAGMTGGDCRADRRRFAGQTGGGSRTDERRMQGIWAEVSGWIGIGYMAED
jgi:hypothetical protein